MSDRDMPPPTQDEIEQMQREDEALQQEWEERGFWSGFEQFLDEQAIERIKARRLGKAD